MISGGTSSGLLVPLSGAGPGPMSPVSLGLASPSPRSPSAREPAEEGLRRSREISLEEYPSVFDLDAELCPSDFAQDDRTSPQEPEWDPEEAAFQVPSPLLTACCSTVDLPSGS